jgi:hypothetical protein
VAADWGGKHFRVLLDLQLILVFTIDYFKQSGSSKFAFLNVRHEVGVVADRHGGEENTINGSKHIIDC